LSSKPDRFKVITDSEAYTYQSNDGEKHYSIIETAERYRRKQNIYNPYIAYYNNNLNQLLVISYS
jgi:hypothetical protein